MHRTLVINAVGLTPSLLGDATPRLRAFAQSGKVAAIGHVLPAVTCSVQATYLTGAWPSEHGIVGNGWYFRDECEIKFWRQSNKLIQQPLIWDESRRIDPSFTCANICWWYNMYSSADYSVTPRPMYPADGRKIPDCYTHPAKLRDELQARLGQFPLFQFWGPATSIRASQWIADAAMHIDEKFQPTLALVYLPHLDYVLQRHGPDSRAAETDLRELDNVCGQLVDHFSRRQVRIIILSEYGIARVRRPVHLNRVLRENNLLALRKELGRELLDAGASKAFAVADHQVAHIYVNDRAEIARVAELISRVPGVAKVLDESGKRDAHLDHPRAGELLALAEADAWFTYYYWLDDRRAPDFARTVDIHRKPGYDPAELFIDPAMAMPKARIAATLLKKKLGFRTLMQVTPLDAALVGGSHGLPPASAAEGPLLISQQADLLPESALEATKVKDVILRHLTQ